MYKKYMFSVLIFMGVNALGMHNRENTPHKTHIELKSNMLEVYDAENNENGSLQGANTMQAPSCSEEQLFCLGATLEAIRCFVCGL